MAAELERELGATCTLVGGGSGVFDVVADGKPVFSKHTAGRFPEAEEILTTLRARR